MKLQDRFTGGREDPQATPDARVLAGVACVHRLLELVRDAEHTLRVGMYVVRSAPRGGSRLYALLWDQLRRAPGRGLQCDLVLDAHRRPRWHAAANLAAGWELEACGWRVRSLGGAKVHHAKLWLFDSRVAVVGSHNLTEAAALRAEEISVELREGTALRAVWEYWCACWREGVPLPPHGSVPEARGRK